MGLKEKTKFIQLYPDFFLKLFKIKLLLRNLKKEGKQAWVFQCDFKGHFPYLEPFYEYSKNINDVDVFFAVGPSKNDKIISFLLKKGVSYKKIIYPIDCLRFTKWDVYMSPTEWGNVFPGNEDAFRVQLFHTLGDKKIEYSDELLKFNVIFANGPIHHTFLEKYIFSKYPYHKKRCKVINTGFAKIDDLFNGYYSKNKLREKLGICKNDKRPILLYAPNWEATSALYKYGESVFEQFTKLDCLVLIKLHYMSLISIEDHNATLSKENHGNLHKKWIDWKKILNKYEAFENIRILDNQSLNPWMYLADIMITDYGGASLEFICTGKPVIYLDCPEFFDLRGYEIFEYESRKTGPVIDNVKNISKTINDLLDENTDKFIEERKIMIKNLIYDPGNAAKNGFNEVYELVKSKT